MDLGGLDVHMKKARASTIARGLREAVLMLSLVLSVLYPVCTGFLRKGKTKGKFRIHLCAKILVVII